MDIDWSNVHLVGNYESLQLIINQRHLIDNKSNITHDSIVPKVYPGHTQNYTLYREKYFIVYGESTIRSEGQGLSQLIAIENGALVALRAIEFIDGILHAKYLRETNSTSTYIDDLLSTIGNEESAQEASDVVPNVQYGCVLKTVPTVTTTTLPVLQVQDLEPLDLTQTSHSS